MSSATSNDTARLVDPEAHDVIRDAVEDGRFCRITFAVGYPFLLNRLLATDTAAYYTSYTVETDVMLAPAEGPAGTISVYPDYDATQVDGSGPFFGGPDADGTAPTTECAGVLIDKHGMDNAAAFAAAFAIEAAEHARDLEREVTAVDRPDPEASS